MVTKRGSKAVKGGKRVKGKRVKNLPAKALKADQAKSVKGGWDLVHNKHSG